MQSMRGIASLMLGLGLALIPVTAMAHTGVESSDPADGTILTDAPEEVVVTFEGEVDDEANFTVTGPDGEVVGTGELDLDVADRNVLRGDVTVVEPGVYVIAWAVVGDDGHEVDGELSFTYDPDGEVTPPDTALPLPTGSPLTVIGAMALLLAGAVTARGVVAERG